MALLDIPIDVPWKLISASRDMMDTQFSNTDFPPQWRSSMAIYGYEPKLEDSLGIECGIRITYLKISCSITGLQCDQKVKNGFYNLTREILKPLTNAIPMQVLKDKLNEYFGCYGVLLNVSVLPYFADTGKPGIKRIKVDFSKYSPGQTITTPLIEQEIVFSPIETTVLNIIHISTLHAEDRGELNLAKGVEVTIPSKMKCSRVGAKLCLGRDGGSVSMLAYRGRTQLDVKTFQSDSNGSQVLTIENDGIDRVIFKSQVEEKGASLMEMDYDTLIDLSDYPHIVDFEPKKRDLYQSATEEGEILTGSQSEIAVTKSLTHTESSQLGVDMKASAGVGIKAPSPGEGKSPVQAGGEISGGISAGWGKTNTDTTTTQIDSSRDRRERQAATTQISQMYNLLTGYHAGTNRALFLMLPRPHILQPTDLRTFVNGFKGIGGIQDFFLVIVRPAWVPGLFVKTLLDTGHFSEKVTQRDPEYEKSHEDFEVQKWCLSTRTLAHFTSIYTVREGYVIDTDPDRKDFDYVDPLSGLDFYYKPDPYHRGVQELESKLVQLVDINTFKQERDPEGGYLAVDYVPSTYNLPKSIPPPRDYVRDPYPNTLNIPGQYIKLDGNRAGITNYHYQAENSTTVRVEGEAHGDLECSFRGRYRVFTRSITPKPRAVDDDLLIASRGLTACLASGNECIEILDIPENMAMPSDWFVVDEPHIKTSPSLLENTGRNIVPGDLSYNQDTKISVNDDDDRTGEVTNKLNRTISSETRQQGEMHLPAIKDLLQRIESTMIGSTNSITRRALGETSYLESDYFMKSITDIIDPSLLTKRISEIDGISTNIISKHGNDEAGRILRMDIAELSLSSGISIHELTNIKRHILEGLKKFSSKETKV